jgi:hypothetical protein
LLITRLTTPTQEPRLVLNENQNIENINRPTSSEANNNFATPLSVTQERTRRSNVKQETNEEFTRITRSRSIRLGTTSSSSSSSRTDQNILKITTPSINTQSVDSRRSIKRVTTLRR